MPTDWPVTAVVMEPLLSTVTSPLPLMPRMPNAVPPEAP